MEIDNRQYHLILAIEELASARLELIEATKYDPDPGSWDFANIEIDRAMESIMQRLI